LRGFDAGRTGRLIAALFREQRFTKPIFILGAPRSGTTFVFRCLASCPSLGALPREGHDMWRMFHHPRYRGWKSDSVGPGEVRPGERRFVGAYLRSYFPHERFVEKTPENSFRVPYLLDLFPDALFLVVRRDPFSTINSIINGWRDPSGRFRSYFVPQRLSIPGYPHSHRWCFALVDGWRELASLPIPEIAFAQWAAFSKALAQARGAAPKGRWLEIRLEDLLREPVQFAERISHFADIESTEKLKQGLLADSGQPVYATSGDRPADWRGENCSELRRLAPRIAALAPQTGYRLEQTGSDWNALPAENG
jgi:hypothetical protein